MFATLRAEIESRFAAVESFCSATSELPAEDQKTARGLAFVHIYSVYEHTVRTAVEISIDLIVAQKHPTNTLAPLLLAIFLDPQLKSLQDSKAVDAWECRLTLFQKAFSDDPAAVNNQVMPHDGSHFRYSQLRFLLRVFGINRLPIRHQIHAARIDEVVRNRNAVAHGRETAENVGKRYTQSDIQHVSRQMRNVCKFFIGILQPHFLNPAKHRRR